MLDHPESPSKPAVSNINAHAIDLTWDEPSDNGGAPVSSYVIEKCDMETQTWRRALSTRAKVATIGCLDEHKEYKFRVLAENFIGVSKPGEETAIITTRQPTPDINYEELCKLIETE